MIRYDLGNIAEWLSAIGTIGAVVIALYLSKRDIKPNIKVTSEFINMSDMDYSNEETINIRIRASNLGLRPITLLECSLEIDKENIKLKKSDVSKLLNPGEIYEHELQYEAIETMKRSLDEKKTKSNIRAFFIDSSGNKHRGKRISLSDIK